MQFDFVPLAWCFPFIANLLGIVSAYCIYSGYFHYPAMDSGRSKGDIVRSSFLSLTSCLVSGLPPWPRAFLEALFLLGKRTER